MDAITKTRLALLVSLMMLGSHAFAQIRSVDAEARIARMTDAIIAMAPVGMELGEQLSENSPRLNEFVPGQTPAKLDCLRREFARDAFRNRKLTQVAAYVEAHPIRATDDYALLDSLAKYLRSFSRADGELPEPTDAEQRALTALFEDSKYQTLRGFIGMTRLQRALTGIPSRTTRDQELTYRSLAVETAPALHACHVVYPRFVEEALVYTAAYADPALLTPDFGRECRAPMVAPQPDVTARTVTPARPDPRRPFKAPIYPDMARRTEIEGTAMIEVMINEHGETTGARVKQSSGSILLDSSALHAARDWRLLPGSQNGSPVCMNVILPLVFKLSD